MKNLFQRILLIVEKEEEEEEKNNVQWQGGEKKKKARKRGNGRKAPLLYFTIREIKKQKPCIGGREDSFVIP